MKTQAMIINNLTDGGVPAECDVTLDTERLVLIFDFMDFAIEIACDEAMKAIVSTLPQGQ